MVFFWNKHKMKWRQAGLGKPGMMLLLATVPVVGLALAGLGLARAVRQFRPDLIHLHTEIPEASWAMTAYS